MNSYVGVCVGALAGLAAGFGLDPWGADSGRAEALASAQPMDDVGREVSVSEELAERAQLTVHRVEKQSFGRSLELVGTVAWDGDRVADVGSRVDGRIVRMLVSVGDQVEAGQPVAEIESSSHGEVVARLLSARANLIAAQSRAQREAQLGAKQLSRASAVEQAEAEAGVLRAEVQAAKQQLYAMGFSARQVASPTAAGLTGRITLRAPIAGEVVTRSAALGQVVAATHSILRIADLSRLWVHLDLFDRELAIVAVGDAVEFRCESYPDVLLHGAVDHVYAALDPATRSAHVRLKVENPGKLLRQGQLVTASISTRGDRRNAVRIPARAVLRSHGESRVFVARGPTRFAERVVALGPLRGELIEVVSGLVPGDLLVADGAFVLDGELER